VSCADKLWCHSLFYIIIIVVNLLLLVLLLLLSSSAAAAAASYCQGNWKLEIIMIITATTRKD